MAAIIALSTLFLSNTVKAQTAPGPWRLGFGIEGGLPTGDANDFYNIQIGGTVRLQYSLKKNLALTLTSGYYHFIKKDEIAGLSDLQMIPVKVGIKSFFAPHLYFGAEAGAGFELNESNNTKLLLSPALGWAGKSWDFGVKYENFSGQKNNYGVVGLRVAYGFGI